MFNSHSFWVYSRASVIIWYEQFSQVERTILPFQFNKNRIEYEILAIMENFHLLKSSNVQIIVLKIVLFCICVEILNTLNFQLFFDLPHFLNIYEDEGIFNFDKSSLKAWSFFFF